MKVKHRLSRAGARIYYRPVATLTVALVIRNSSPNTKQMAQHRFVRLRSVVERFKMFARDH
jgi:hypothetical protein